MAVSPEVPSVLLVTFPAALQYLKGALKEKGRKGHVAAGQGVMDLKGVYAD